MAGNGKNSITLRITGPDGRTYESITEQDSLILGSGAGAAIRIPDPGVSNLHVMLRVEKNGVVKAIDLGSEQGTTIGERPLRGPMPLSPGDVLRLGSSRVEVRFNAAASPAVATQARGVMGAGVAAAARKADVLPESLVPFDAPATGELAPGSGRRVLQVALVWGDHVIGLRHYGDGVPVTVGEAQRNEFQVFAPGVGESFTLIRARGDKGLVNLPGGAAVTLFSGPRRLGREQLRAEGRLRPGGGGEVLELALDERVKVSLGTVCLLARFVAPSARVPVKRLAKEEATFLVLSVLSLLVGAAVVAWFWSMPQSTRRGLGMMDDEMASVVKLLVKPAKKPIVPKPRPKDEKSAAEEGARPQGTEGAFGKPEAKQAEADPSRRGSPKVNPDQKERDRKRVLKMGLLGAINSNGAASDVFGPGGLGSGINDKLGGLRGGAGLTDRQGVGGLGSRGGGTGGGGTGLGLGGLGTRGDGPGTGGRGIELGGRGHDTTRIIPGKTVVVGGLSREAIAKVIRDHQREIKYCYETELNKIPDLAGKVAVLFVIGPDGAVQEANVSETSLNNGSAEQCMITRIKRWRFPEPQGGGIVTVTFPWIFKPAGD